MAGWYMFSKVVVLVACVMCTRVRFRCFDQGWIKPLSLESGEVFFSFINKTVIKPCGFIFLFKQVFLGSVIEFYRNPLLLRELDVVRLYVHQLLHRILIQAIAQL